METTEPRAEATGGKMEGKMGGASQAQHLEWLYEWLYMVCRRKPINKLGAVFAERCAAVG